IVALVTDVGYVYYDHARLQTATNAAWKAGYDKLAEIRKTKSRLTAEDETIIKNHMLEVMAANGFSNLTADQLKIMLTQNQTNLKINANDEVDLFFMKIFDINKADVAAARAGGVDASAIMPIAIPHGEVHDLSWKTYDFVKFEDGEGFATGTEYIIKLGESEGNDPLGKEDYMIYIPTGLLGTQPNGPNNDGTPTMLAYGAIYWALQIDERDKESLTPAYWFLSDNGGGFLMRKGAVFEQKLKSGDYKGVTYHQYYADQILNLLSAVGVTNVDKEHINDYLTGLAKGEIKNSRIIPLTWRPQIAIYSSQAARDPVEEILVAAKIPYGTYALPQTTTNTNGWDRNSDYDSSKNTKIFDIEILNGELDKYDWIHLHHEDFTGQTVEDAAKYCYGAFPTTCQKIKPGCSHNIAIGTEKVSSQQQKAINYVKELACANCKEHMQITTEQFSYHSGRQWITKYKARLTGWDVDLSTLNAQCLNAVVDRCENCGVFDENNLSNQTNFSGCKFYKYLNEHYGYTDDTPFPYVFQESDLSLSPYNLCVKWFSQATAYQKMKWDVAETIKSHILKGGFMYTQCFAAETIDLSLQQGAFYKNKNLQDSYENCMIFKDFTYNKLPSKGGQYSQGYSSIFNNSFGNGT
ncbi:MAG: Tad domain-containing protein, partial [Candidatus Riflebacteria bacterium]|nr:Tad domain-containing protein [Candidatus Riflebacteria bacterium]